MTDQRITCTNQDPFGAGGLGNAPAFPGTPEFASYIEQQEAAGQREVVESQDLPTDTGGTDQEFLALGFTFGEPHGDDPLFRPTTLPAGWSREGTSHSMHSRIVDDKGRERVSIFYKAAFYDRRAYMRLVLPTARLMNAIWVDAEPTGVELDELLNAETARGYLERYRAGEVEDMSLFPEGSSRDRCAARIARIDKLLSLLPPGGGSDA